MNTTRMIIVALLATTGPVVRRESLEIILSFSCEQYLGIDRYLRPIFLTSYLW